MAERKPEPLTFERGLHREFDTPVPGTAARLINWDVMPDGGLRTRRQWVPGTTAGQPAQRQVRAIGSLPVLAGYETPIRRQFQRRFVRGLDVDDIEAVWDQPTVDGSLLLAFLVISDKDRGVGSGRVTVTTPAGWTELSGAGLPNNGQFPIRDNATGANNPWLKGFVYYIGNAASRDGGEMFTFNAPVRRAQLYIMEWRGVARSTDVTQLFGETGDSTPGGTIGAKADSGFSTNPNTGLFTGETGPKSVAVGFLAGMPSQGNFELEDHTSGWYDFRFPKDKFSTGKNDYWLDMKVYRRVFTQNETTFNLEASWAEEGDIESVEAYWIAGMVNIKARFRVNNDRDYYLVANKDSATTYRYYYIDEDDLVAGAGAWAELVPFTVAGRTVTDGTDGQDGHYLSLASGMGVMLFTHKDFAQVWAWDGDLLMPIRRSFPGRTVGFWNNQFFTGGGEDQANLVHACEIGDYTTWPEDYNFPVGDGSPVVDIAPVREGLLIAKFDSLWFFNGQSLVKLDGGGGSWGRCILSVPGGAFIAGRRHIWYWGGGSVELVSRPVHDWWAQGWEDGTRMLNSVAYIGGKSFFGDALEDSILSFDLEGETHPWEVQKGPGDLVYCQSDRNLVAGPWNSATAPLLSIQRYPHGDRERDTGLAETFEAWTQELQPATPGKLCTPRWLYISWRQRETTAAEPTVQVTPVYDGIAQTPRYLAELHGNTPPPNTVQGADGLYRTRLDVGVTARTPCNKVQFRFLYQMAANETTCIDIERVVFVYEESEWV